MNSALQKVGGFLAYFLTRNRHLHGTFSPTSAAQLRATLEIGDVLLVEGSSRVSTAIKFLTQSTWSHAALYVGDTFAQPLGADQCFIEVDMQQGVRSCGLETFAGLHTRICRPFGLNESERQQVAAYAVARLGQQYDLRNITDLMRYLLPAPPVPSRFRRQLLTLGSGDPTRAICSTLIAQAFQSLHYPILPVVQKHDANSPKCPGCVEEIYKLRHHSLFTPRDFDVSPYFQIVKPMQTSGFNFRELQWEDVSS